MHGLRSLLLAVLPLITYSAALAADLQDDLRDVPDESIRAALERTLAPKYQLGVFEHAENALEVVHSESPELATRVVDAAKQDLMQKLDMLKRQNNVTIVTDTSAVVVISTTVATTAVIESTSSQAAIASTTSSTTSPASTAIIQSSNSQLIVPSVVSTTNAAGSPSTTTTQAVITSASASAVVSFTTTNAQGNPVTTSSTLPAVVVSSTNPAGSVVVTTSPISSAVIAASSTTLTTTPVAGNGASSSRSRSATNTITTKDNYGQDITLTDVSPGATISTTDASGRAVVITYTPGGGVFTRPVFRTTTLPNGERSTITTYESPDQPTGTTAVAETTTPSVTPTLQPGSAVRHQAGPLAAVLGGALGLLAVI